MGSNNLVWIQQRFQEQEDDPFNYGLIVVSFNISPC